MKNVVMIAVAVALATSIGISQPVSAEKLSTFETVGSFAEMPEKEIHNASKNWRIKLSMELDPSTFNNDNVYVIDENGDKLTTFVQYKEGTKEGVVRAPSIGYEENVQYTLVITDGVESTKGVALAQGVKMNFELSSESDSSADKSIHEYSKAELEAWIDKENDLERLGAHPIDDVTGVVDSVEGANYLTLHPSGDSRTNRIEMVTEIMNDSSGYMDVYYNRDYRTIGDDWIVDIRQYFVDPFTYKGDSYSTKQLPQLFDRFVQETKDGKLTSESIFVTDTSMVFFQQAERESGYGSDFQRITRGTQYIRYTSGVDLPEGVVLNKWYKRDVDVDTDTGFTPPDERPWDAVENLFEDIYPLTSYEEVKK